MASARNHALDRTAVHVDMKENIDDTVAQRTTVDAGNSRSRYDGCGRAGSMFKTNAAATTAVALLLAASAAWYFGSPAWTLREMKAAADANDVDALNAYIDYPAVRENLKAELTAQMLTKSQKDKSGLGGLGMAIGSALIGPIIDELISPAGMRAALIAKSNQEPSSAVAGSAKALQLPQNPVIERRSFSEFVVATKKRSHRGLVFKLHGLSWKLSGVELAPDEVPAG